MAQNPYGGMGGGPQRPLGGMSGNTNMMGGGMMGRGMVGQYGGGAGPGNHGAGIRPNTPTSSGLSPGMIGSANSSNITGSGGTGLNTNNPSGVNTTGGVSTATGSNTANIPPITVNNGSDGTDSQGGSGPQSGGGPQGTGSGPLTGQGGSGQQGGTNEGGANPQQQQKEYNMSAVCRIGQETVEEIVSRTQEVFSILKQLQPPVGPFSPQSQQNDRSTLDRQARLQEVLKGIGLLFKRLRVCWEKCEESTASIEYAPIQALIPIKDDSDSYKNELEKKRGDAYKTALEEHNELIQQIVLKNRHLKEIIDQMRNIIWEINTMLAMRQQAIPGTPGMIGHMGPGGIPGGPPQPPGHSWPMNTGPPSVM